ncbi:HPP family protein [Desulfovibrio litoralis]|uniref:HPP family protein n=1 Tax=Desulfovibrio litoralis DSM 11393 TaxID=1121455 RepID=A0A1M7T2C6_9BACT|nr:HPP family protein [Desulfovibrio litoralis]SHN64861.1 HPP family protein [Desulfovibrio litoralis DSM 11393]
MQFFKKMRGCQKRTHSTTDFNELLWSIIGLFVAIGGLSGLQLILFGSLAHGGIIIAPLGASAIIIFSSPNSPFSQPRNLVLGHIISAFCGVSSALIFKEHIWLASGLAVSSAFLCMQLAQAIHPPGGATALFAVIGGANIKQLGYLYVLMPAGIGAVVLMVIALIFINLSKNRQYPQYWR